MRIEPDLSNPKATPRGNATFFDGVLEIERLCLRGLPNAMPTSLTLPLAWSNVATATAVLSLSCWRADADPDA